MRFEPFLQNFLQQIRLLLLLIRDPEQGWISLKIASPDWKQVYYQLIFPLTGLLGILIFFNQLSYDDFASAALYFLFETGVALLLIYLSSLLVYYLAQKFGRGISRLQAQACVPYIFVPFLAGAVLAAALSETFPVLAGMLSYLIYLGSLITGGYMLYYFSRYYLDMADENRILFAGLAGFGIIVLSAVLYLMETELIYRFIVRGF